MSAQLPIARFAVQLVANVGVTKVVHDVIRNNVNIVVPADAVKVWVGSLVIGSIIVDQATAHVNGYMDRAVAWNEERKNATTELQVVES